MGGHGAITCALKNPTKYVSVSAFAPILNPTDCAWGKKCLGGYLGSDTTSWAQYDSTLLAKNYSGPEMKILIHQVINCGAQLQSKFILFMLYLYFFFYK